MTAVELPTAFPYMVAIGAIVDPGVGPARQLVLPVVFNGCFVLPMPPLLAVVALAGERAQPPLRRARETVEHRWRVTFALVVRFAGLGVLALA
jgi:Sap, sulfolipid-1-addressing protein